MSNSYLLWSCQKIPQSAVHLRWCAALNGVQYCLNGMQHETIWEPRETALLGRAILFILLYYAI
jgi:hypothetical protein